jgi:phage shock protein C
MRGRLDDVSVRWNVYRNTTRGKIAGVCAGLSDRLAVKTLWVRAAFVVFAVVYHAIPAVLLYLALAIIIRPRDEPIGYVAPDAMPSGGPPSYGRAAGAAYTSSMPSAAPGSRLTELKTRFTALDARLNRIDAIVTSEELSLRRKFRDLGA